MSNKSAIFPGARWSCSLLYQDLLSRRHLNGHCASRARSPPMPGLCPLSKPITPSRALRPTLIVSSLYLLQPRRHGSAHPVQTTGNSRQQPFGPGRHLLRGLQLCTARGVTAIVDMCGLATAFHLSACLKHGNSQALVTMLL